MASYGVKYVFRFESTNKANIEIQILQKNYQGARTYRSLGRAPILKREKSGCIHGSSLELYAECQINAEFASLYTSSADEYKVEIYKIDEFLGDTIMRRLWTGFVSPELYSEPDIAPPYDVQIIATDGLGELKNYDFETRGLQTIGNHLSHLLEHTGLSQELNVVSFMTGNSGTVPIMDVAVSLDHMAGESCYDVLKAVLDSFHAEIACQDGYWMIWRETDLVNLSSQVEVAEFGSKTKADWWPVGQLSTVIEPAKKKVVVISENAYKDNVLKDIPYHANGATFDSEEKAFVLPAADTSVFKTLNFGEEVGYKLSLSVTARNVGAGEEGQNVGIKVKIGGRSYIAGDTFWLKETTNGKTAWSNVEGVIEKTLEAPSTSDSSKEAQAIVLELPLYHYNNRAYHYATSIEVTVINLDGNYPIHVYDVALSKLDRQKGYKSAVVIDNGAREESEEVTLILADNERIPASAQIFMDGIALDADGNPIGTWASGRLAALKYLAFMSRDYALSVALPRMKVQGVLNVPESALITPVLFLRDNTYYFPETYSYDLFNDEMSVNLISIPTASISVVSEEVTEVVDPFQSRPGGSAGGGSSSGGSSGGGNASGGGSVTIDPFLSDTSSNPVESKAIKAYIDSADNEIKERIAALEEGGDVDHPVFEFTFDSATNKATAEMVAALAEAIAANKLILCNGRTYKFILEQDGMYGLVSDAYMDIMDGKLKTSVLAVMASSYDVQLMEEEVPVGTEITEDTVRGWGFTKNQGTITGIKMNGATKGTSGVVDLGNVLTEHQQLKTINGQSIVGEGNITIQGGGATPRVEMTAASASIEPNKFYVWGDAESLNLTLAEGKADELNRYLFQFKTSKTAYTILQLPDDVTWSDDTELGADGMPVIQLNSYHRVEIIEGLATLRRWKIVSQFIEFADAEVERTLILNGVGTSEGITKKAAAAVTDIGTWFANRDDITSFDELRFFKNVVTLYSSAFDRCVNLESVDISNVRTLDGRFHFRECASLKGVIDAPYLTSISEDGFQGTAIDGINAPMVTEVGWNAFQNCGNLKSAVFGDVLTTLYERAFENCTALTSIDVSHVSQLVGRKHFRNCTSLEGVMQFPYLTIISEECFQNAKIEGVNAPMVREIGWNAFQNCWNMKSAIFGEALTAIYGDAFHSASSLTEIVIRATTPPSLTNTRALENTNNCPIYVPDASVEAYKSATNWNTYADRIKGISEYTG